MPEPTREMPPVCEACGELRGSKSLHIDHCHMTGIFRGWLCSRCNTGLGLLGDNAEGLRKVLAYLDLVLSQ